MVPILIQFFKNSVTITIKIVYFVNKNAGFTLNLMKIFIGFLIFLLKLKKINLIIIRSNFRIIGIDFFKYNFLIK